ncbi:hypothetical protein T02_3399 [Trichinella nativa]|uniref:Uncharacterized protein n=1 Tax=Trichinella nativa TaxID=6335 RepID=A0A0V1KNQ0_9BILA|nr:hypothetical protein T02_3399 [Trichinella nativa]
MFDGWQNKSAAPSTSSKGTIAMRTEADLCHTLEGAKLELVKKSLKRNKRKREQQAGQRARRQTAANCKYLLMRSKLPLGVLLVVKRPRLLASLGPFRRWRILCFFDVDVE